MHRNLKILGLALAAAFALGAVAVASASAQTGVLTTENEQRATLTGFNTGLAGSNALTAFGNSTECPGSTYTGHKFEVTPHEPLANGAEILTITPHYKQLTAEGKKNCKVAGLPLTITMNGCDYQFYNFQTDPTKVHEYTFTTGIVCPGANKIELETYLGESEGVKACTIKLGSQTGLEGGRATNTPASGETPNDIDLTGTIKGIHLERTGLCVSEDITTSANCELHLDMTFKGDNELGEPLGVTISD